jgi:BNR repeat-like domain
VTRIGVSETATVWEAEPDDPAGHACEPRVTRLASGAIVLSHRVGTTREGADGRPRLVGSDDDGATWRPLASPFVDALPAGWDLRGCALAELAGGDLVAVVVAIDKTSGRPAYNPATEGLLPIRNLMARSTDGGETWSEPWDLADGRRVQLASQGLLALPDGGLLCTFETFKTYDDPGVWRYTGGLLRSDDGGRTWGAPVISAASDPDGDPHDTMWWDPRIARLSSGDLVQCYYAFRHATRTEGPVHIAWSPDDGATWTAPVSTELPGQATYPLPLAGGRLLVFQQRRAETQAMVAVISDDGGRTFDRASEQVVYAHADESAPGADGSLSAFDYLMSMDRFTFGHPCGVVTGPNEALLFWYAGGRTRTSIRSARLQVD